MTHVVNGHEWMGSLLTTRHHTWLVSHSRSGGGGGFSNIWVNGNCLRPRPDLHQPSVPQPPGPAPSAQHLRDVERGVAAALRARDALRQWRALLR